MSTQLGCHAYAFQHPAEPHRCTMQLSVCVFIRALHDDLAGLIFQWTAGTQCDRNITLGCSGISVLQDLVQQAIAYACWRRSRAGGAQNQLIMGMTSGISQGTTSWSAASGGRPPPSARYRLMGAVVKWSRIDLSQSLLGTWEQTGLVHVHPDHRSYTSRRSSRDASTAAVYRETNATCHAGSAFQCLYGPALLWKHSALSQSRSLL